MINALEALARMVNVLVYHVASGQAFFSGVVLIHIAVLVGLRKEGGRWRAIARNASADIGLLLIAVSATPLAIGFYVVAGAVSIAWLCAEGWAATRARPWLRVAVLAAWWVGAAMELPYHMWPPLPKMNDPVVFVVGDSLSAGMGGERGRTWPKMFAREHGVRVNDLSLAGADVSTALKEQAGRVVGADILVIAEIGGNDVLGGTTPEAFERGLDALLAVLRRERGTVVMLELPLPPSYNRFGSAQRRLARRHGVLLVPKRVLMGVLTTEGATLDTIHLSPKGHAMMAEAVWKAVRGAFGAGRR